MRTYELVLVFRPSLKEEERKKLLDTIKSWLKDMKLTREEEWWSKALTYAIKKELTGFYYALHLQSEKGIEKDFEKRLINQDQILRHLLVRRK